MTTDLIIQVNNPIGQFQLNRPKALNSLTLPMIRQIHQQTDQWSEQADIAFILFPTLAEKVYCAGGDIRWLYQQGKDGNHENQMAFFAEEYRLDYAIARSDKPVAAIVDGFLIGGGMGLLMPVDTLYATESSMFCMPETGIGFFPDVGMAHRFNQCPGKTGLYLALTGQRFNAYDAVYLGLADGVLTNEDAQQVQTNLLAEKDSKLVYETFQSNCAARTLSVEKAPISEFQTIIDEVFSLSSVQEMMTELAKRSEEWAKQTLAQLKNACPLSLQVTFELMKRTAGMDAASAYILDYNVAGHFMRCPDFYEGVRAQVVDKDKQPRWQYHCVEAVSQESIDQFFEPLEKSLDLTYHPVRNSSEFELDF